MQAQKPTVATCSQGPRAESELGEAVPPHGGREEGCFTVLVSSTSYVQPQPGQTQTAKSTGHVARWQGVQPPCPARLP